MWRVTGSGYEYAAPSVPRDRDALDDDIITENHFMVEEIHHRDFRGLSPKFAAQETTQQEVLEGTKQYIVPLYQRPYQWGKKQLQDLWDDLVELADDRRVGARTSHFIGSLVLAPPPVTVAGGVTTYLVVDGQQRLTTLTLLLAAIRDYRDSVEPEEQADE